MKRRWVIVAVSEKRTNTSSYPVSSVHFPFKRLKYPEGLFSKGALAHMWSIQDCGRACSSQDRGLSDRECIGADRVHGLRNLKGYRSANMEIGGDMPLRNKKS